ncbi:hypothetical protein ATO6_02425 [Oceanicola sp. 22II-s10i]|uniref:hypothetical protein n=1 Tax=Oceanicola sp. 22II-s10i TaxID=1317116 RepID=UPI000B51F2A3|nr:hypothetical protein [Oceanicola sp. 22II-s10i]OWU85786.1 hypothetical protein ATO6_02425 [Oceanicola sp. 22II-s10i]
MTDTISLTDGQDTALRDRWPDLFRGAFLVISLLFVLGLLAWDVSRGGHGWKQGDWLINDLEGPIRRGPFGSAMIGLADLLGTSPLIVVASLQAVLTVGLYAVVWRLGNRMPDRRAALILTLSPAMFAVFWVADPTGGLRKELIAFLALALAGTGVAAGSRVAFAAGTALMALAVWSHEALILFLPTWLVLAGMGLHIGLGRLFLTVLSVALAVASALALGYALGHPTVDDHMTVCAALLERGTSEHMCNAAVRWTERGAAAGAAAVMENLNPVRLAGSAIAYALSLLAAGHVIHTLPRRKTLFVLALAAAVPFLPLYPVALDWGRWIAFHVFSVTVILMTSLAAGIQRPSAPIGRAMTLRLVVLALLISPAHTTGAELGGALRTLLEETIWLV